MTFDRHVKECHGHSAQGDILHVRITRRAEGCGVELSNTALRKAVPQV